MNYIIKKIKNFFFKPKKSEGPQEPKADENYIRNFDDDGLQELKIFYMEKEKIVKKMKH